MVWYGIVGKTAKIYSTPSFFSLVSFPSSSHPSVTSLGPVPSSLHTAHHVHGVVPFIQITYRHYFPSHIPSRLPCCFVFFRLLSSRPLPSESVSPLPSQRSSWVDSWKYLVGSRPTIWVACSWVRFHLGYVFRDDFFCSVRRFHDQYRASNTNAVLSSH